LRSASRSRCRDLLDFGGVRRIVLPIRRATILGFIAAVFALGAIAVLAGLGAQEQNPRAGSNRKSFDEKRFPIADFSAPEPTDPIQRAKRRARARKHDKSDWAVNPEATSDTTVRVDFVDQTLPAFPLAPNTFVVAGKITDSRAYLSNDKTGIYSVFSLQVEEVLMNASAKVLAPGALLELEREGGRVKFPSGRVNLYMIKEQDMPEIGSTYVFFLIDSDNETVFEIVTAYELRDGKVYPLDDLRNSRTYQNADVMKFMTELKTKIASF